jgi:hypothetical protein
MSSGAFVIEVRGETAGLALVASDQVQFVASDAAFMALDGRLYRSVQQAQRAAEALVRERECKQKAGREVEPKAPELARTG